MLSWEASSAEWKVPVGNLDRHTTWYSQHWKGHPEYHHLFCAQDAAFTYKVVGRFQCWVLLCFAYMYIYIYLCIHTCTYMVLPPSLHKYVRMTWGEWVMQRADDTLRSAGVEMDYTTIINHCEPGNQTLLNIAGHCEPQKKRNGGHYYSAILYNHYARLSIITNH